MINRDLGVDGSRLGAWTDLTMPIDWQWMPDQSFADSVQVRVAGAGDALKGIRLGGESGTCIVLPSMFAPFRKTTTVHELEVVNLMMCQVAVIRLQCDSASGIRGSLVGEALEAFSPADVDGVMLVTGHGDQFERYRGTDSYMLESPFLEDDVIVPVAKFLAAKPFKLFMTDLAMLGRPATHMLPEWCSPRPGPASFPSEQAVGYLKGYRMEQYFKDFSVDLSFAQENVVVVKKLVAAGSLSGNRVMVCLAPLNCVRAKSAPCRVVAAEIEEDETNASP